MVLAQPESMLRALTRFFCLWLFLAPDDAGSASEYGDLPK